jgi:biopolymer transport protein TolR
MAMTTGNSNGGFAADMNVTPLIDVLLVLIIIFMVITPVTPNGLEARVPQPAKPAPVDPVEPPRAVIVQVINTNGTPLLKINKEDVAWENLETRLIDIYKTRAEKVLFVSADTTLDFSDVARVIDSAHAAGIDNIGLITEKIAGS